jgi:hypothetical protein
MADGVKVHIDGKAYDLEDFELGELEWLEEYIGASLNDDDALRSMKTAVAFVYLLKKRDDPEFTIEQARKIKLSVFDEAETNGNGKPAKRRPTKAAPAAE